ncbi:S41 family peptidase [Pseudomonadota bacterium]
MIKRSKYVLFLLLGLMLGFVLTVEQDVLAERKQNTQPLPLEDLQNFTEVFGKIKGEYVESVDDKQLLKDAIQGMLAGLDPHSSYLDQDSFKEMRIGTEGQFGGLGIEVTLENGFVKVVAPIDDTPAAESGVLSGDLIIKLDNKQVKGMSLSDAVKLMRGKPGTDITLTIVREGESKPLEIVLTRAVIKITSVKSRLVDEKIGYVRITQFQSGTTAGLRKHIGKLKKEVGGSLDGLVLDLRNNPGGVLQSAISVSDTFIKKGLIVYTKGRSEDSKQSYLATPNDYLDGAPMVVLTNSGSASASEIVAGALQDHKRAIIMGTKTFGKGSVQTILPMGNGSALKITTARYYTPKDRSIQATGIVPDVVVEDLKLSEAKPSPVAGLREIDLSRHLENEGADKKPGQTDSKKDTKPSSSRRDFQLREAVNLLKGINIVRAYDK